MNNVFHESLVLNVLEFINNERYIHILYIIISNYKA